MVIPRSNLFQTFWWFDNFFVHFSAKLRFKCHEDQQKRLRDWFVTPRAMHYCKCPWDSEDGQSFDFPLCWLFGRSSGSQRGLRSFLFGWLWGLVLQQDDSQLPEFWRQEWFCQEFRRWQMLIALLVVKLVSTWSSKIKSQKFFTVTTCKTASINFIQNCTLELSMWSGGRFLSIVLLKV